MKNLYIIICKIWNGDEDPNKIEQEISLEELQDTVYEKHKVHPTEGTPTAD